jgi:hypothetical protein
VDEHRVVLRLELDHQHNRRLTRARPVVSTY